MAKKVFVSYKYSDSDVKQLPSSGLLAPTTVRNYVDLLATHLEINDQIFQGEDDNESLAGFEDETIASKLRDKIFGSTITVVLISKNMKNPSMREEDQWIPWEISYSLKEVPRNGITSRTNAMLAVVLPDRNGSYQYFANSSCANGCIFWQKGMTFGIIGNNMFNRKQPNLFAQPGHGHGPVHLGNDHSYIFPIKWDEFIPYVNAYLNHALQINQNIDDYEIQKIV
jgi:hypothetical protein